MIRDSLSRRPDQIAKLDCQPAMTGRRRAGQRSGPVVISAIPLKTTSQFGGPLYPIKGKSDKSSLCPGRSLLPRLLPSGEIHPLSPSVQVSVKPGAFHSTIFYSGGLLPTKAFLASWLIQLKTPSTLVTEKQTAKARL